MKMVTQKEILMLNKLKKLMKRILKKTLRKKQNQVSLNKKVRNPKINKNLK